MKKRVLTPREAVNLIEDNAQIILGGFIGAVVPEALNKALGERYQETQTPKNIGIYFAAGQGDAKSKAVNHLAQEGLLKTVVAGHLGLVPKLLPLINDNKVQGYNFPQGVISQLIRDSAAGKPGLITHVGLNTYVDPRVEGGRLNSSTTEDRVSLMTIKGKEYLFYDRINANVTFLRGTTADEHGNVSMEEEALYCENLVAAQLVKNQGGLVIVQVKKIVKAGTIPPQNIRIPGIFVDILVIADDEADHMQTFAEAYNPAYCGHGEKAQQQATQSTQRPLDAKKIIARRAALELKESAIINYGIGTPEVIAEVTDEENVTHLLTATVEPGAIGGTPAGGLSFGASAFPDAIITQDQMFDFYDGGGLDQAFLGLAECDRFGNINVSKFGPKIAGCGGFINITQNAKQVVYCGTFLAGKMNFTTGDGTLTIIEDAPIEKFLQEVQQITFSAKTAQDNHKDVLYVTERAVFRLTQEGVTLIEIAPGIDLDKDVLAKMSFKPVIADDLKLMDARIFKDEPMKLQLKPLH